MPKQLPPLIAHFRADPAEVEKRRKEVEAAQRRLAELRKIPVYPF